MKKIFIILFLFVALMATYASSQLSTPPEYGNEISKLEAAFKANPSLAAQENWFHLVQKANEVFPNNIKLSSLYAYTEFLATGDPASGIKILLPYLHEIKSHPEVALALWRIFNNGVINAKANKDFFSAETPWGMLLAGCRNPINAIEMMETYWAQYIQDNEVVPARLIPAIKSTRKNIDTNTAIEVWRKIISNINNSEIEVVRTKALFELIRKNTEADKEKMQYQAKEARNLLLEKIKTFDTFKESPNNLQKIELTLNKVTPYRRQLKQYSDIPNYEDLKKSVGEYEAQVLNIAYKAYILREFKECLTLVDGLNKKQSNKDSRVLAIKIYCMQKEKFPIQKIIETTDQLLQLEPNNQRAFMLKKMLEAQEEFKQKSK